MKLWRSALTLTLFSALAAPAPAQEWENGRPWSFGWLGKVCGSKDTQDRLVCVSYLAGFENGRFAEAFAEQRPEKRLRAYCKPAEVTVEQLGAIIAKRAADRPDAHHLDAAPVVALILAGIWPCAT